MALLQSEVCCELTDGVSDVRWYFRPMTHGEKLDWQREQLAQYRAREDAQARIAKERGIKTEDVPLADVAAQMDSVAAYDLQVKTVALLTTRVVGLMDGNEELTWPEDVPVRMDTVARLDAESINVLYSYVVEHLSGLSQGEQGNSLSLRKPLSAAG